MAGLDSPTAQKLLQAFMQFRKSDWHQKQIAGLNPSEVKVLLTIKHEMNENNTDLRVSEISKKLHVAPPTVTQILNVLEEEGLVVRSINPLDRRAITIKLTEKGLVVTKQVKKAFTKSFSGLIDYLGEEESKQLAELLFKVFHYYNRSNQNNI